MHENPTVCKHGQQARACYVCELEQTIVDQIMDDSVSELEQTIVELRHALNDYAFTLECFAEVLPAAKNSLRTLESVHKAVVDTARKALNIEEA